MKYPECNRCGVCCYTGPCSFGNSDGKFGCTELIIHENGTTSCGLLINKKVKPEDIGIRGNGCSFQLFPDYYKEKRTEIEIIRKRIYEKENC
jgi:hypothetical protein